ncbi:MAG TPA: N-6 DNA methylase [Bacteroidales bacterium]|nr:N-6 DNA methylase [Bacteroidales bacterium]
MSKLLIHQYYTNLERALQFGKSRNEQSIRTPFLNLLNEYARKLNYEVIAEIVCLGTKGKTVRPDGIVKNLFGLDIGLWESKDEKTDLDEEIDAKIKKGYPLTNILFEDSNTAVLFQRGEEVMRVPMKDPDKLHRILSEFTGFRSETIYRFEDAMEKFKADIPTIVETLRSRIEEAGGKNDSFIAQSASFLELCKAEINPLITEADVREMMIQHLLTGDIFNRIFDDPEFHRHNSIARELEKLLETLFSYGERRNLLALIEHYYDAINSAAAGITDHHEKQKFLKVLYENFYKVYNPKAADRLGVVYTPNEIVQFMIESVDFLLHRHFGKTLSDKEVEILDPATGTGTFITSLIDYIPKQYLAYKYQHEIHANEVAILPYYVANLNIEYTFKQKMGYYDEFRNLCFVDTLDNTDALAFSGRQHDLFALTSENTDRIRRQNSKKISVIIGNPPYNANQANFNDFNKNREYKMIDKRIKETYVKYSSATNKANLYDMYTRFYRWAMDRLNENGILAFITNRSFIDSRAFDGFRKYVQDKFCSIYIIDTKSDVRSNPKIAGTTHNVFGIQTGVAIAFLVKKGQSEGACRIEYCTMEDDWRKEEKLDWLKSHRFDCITFEKAQPDGSNNWINNTGNDFETLIKLISKTGNEENLIKSTTLGIDTHRDSWVYDISKDYLITKIRRFIEVFNKSLEDKNFLSRGEISWSRELYKYYDRGNAFDLNLSYIRTVLYRPFTKRFHYSDRKFNSYLFDVLNLFPPEQVNVGICINMPTNSRGFYCLATKSPFDLHYTGDTQCFPLYSFDSFGVKKENFTDWGLQQFTEHYQDESITKEDIFHYTYAVLHDPAYRKKYELNLKREFPRLPFYDDFRKWAVWGKALMELHIGYETVAPYDLKENTYEVKAEAKRQAKLIREEVQEPDVLYQYIPKIKVKLKADKTAGIIEIDELTFLSGVPAEAWEYKLGNRSALEWILDQYKEKKPSDPTIAEKFNTYRFADYKTHVIDLLKRVCTVSVETMKIVREMTNLPLSVAERGPGGEV